MNPMKNPCIEAYTIAESFPPYINESSESFNEWYEKTENNYFFKKPLSSEEIIQLAKNILSEKISKKSAVSCSDAVRNYLIMQLSKHEREMFGILFLNTQHQPIAFEILFYGTLATSEVHTREIIKRVIAHNAAAVILAHNHPSSNVKPSDADISATRRIINGLSFLDVRVLDHFIVSHGISCSLAELGEI